MSVNLGKKWATFTHDRELKLWGKCEPIMSHVREWTEKKITHVHICPALVVCSLLFDNSKNLILQFFAASLIFLWAFRAELGQLDRVILLFVFLRMTQQLTWQLLRSLSLTKTMLLWFGVVVVSERNSNFFWPWQQGKKHGKRIDLWHNFKSRQFSTTVCVKSYNL